MKACDVLRAAEQLQYTYESEPTQVNEFCALRLPISLLLKVVVLFNNPGPPVTLTSQVVAVALNTGDAQQRIAAVAANPSQKLLLQLEDVEAPAAPGASWEVYFGLPPNVQPSTESPFYVGNVVLFGTGIRSETHHGFTPARFQFEVNRAALAAQRANSRPSLTFVPHGILINGKPSRPEVKAPVRIGKVALAVGTEENAGAQ